ncbi:Cyclin-U4-1 [Capsicum baccatum]|uniref:Cyclin-U4-1 n=1 Tax=Capsicum baccatum TaxID=33114 RepID=A0A2G2W7Y8_CAPBA|nr:Cyclin-U4-1 [Capsicum baccatum]
MDLVSPPWVLTLKSLLGRYRPDDLQILIPVIPSLLASLEIRGVITIPNLGRSTIDKIVPILADAFEHMSSSLFVVAYVYLERFLNLTGCLLTSLNVHRLLITSIMLDIKFVDDDCYNNHSRTEQDGDKNFGIP